MTSLSVDTIKKEVAITLPDKSELSGHIFLSQYSELGAGPQSVFEALTGHKQFIPFESGDQGFFFLNRKHIVLLSYPVEETEPETPLPQAKRTVTVQLRSGQRLLGKLTTDTPEGNRLSDGLNQAQHFLVLQIDDREVLINMDYIVLAQ